MMTLQIKDKVQVSKPVVGEYITQQEIIERNRRHRELVLKILREKEKNKQS